MYMRLFRFTILPENLKALRQVYETVNVPALQSIPGCRFAGLIQSNQQPDECISMTLWDSPEHIEAYERSGKYRELVQALEPFFSASSGWKVQLTEDLRLDYAPVPEEPVITAFPIGAVMEQGEAGEKPPPATLFLRIVSLNLKPGYLDELKRIYQDVIIPALNSVSGCRYAYLVERGETDNSILSVTVWDSPQDAAAYEQSGLFDKLVDKTKHTYSGLTQWKLTLDGKQKQQVVTSADLQVDSYAIVAGRRFQKRNQQDSN